MSFARSAMDIGWEGTKIAGIGAYHGLKYGSKHTIEALGQLLKGTGVAARTGMAGATLGVGSALSRGVGKFAMTGPGGYALMGAYGAAASYDSTKDSALSHFAKEGVKTASDIVLDAAIFALPGAGWYYMGAKMAATAAIHMTGINPGAFVGDIMEEVGKGYRRATRTETPITQNERTMAYTRQAATMLGQTGRKHSFLGSEASAMHN